MRATFPSGPKAYARMIKLRNAFGHQSFLGQWSANYSFLCLKRRSILYAWAHLIASKEKNEPIDCQAKERLTVVSTCLGAFLRTSRCWRPNNVPTVNDDRDSLSCHSSGHQDRVLTCPKKRKRKENKSKNVRKSLITFHFCFFFFFFLILWTWSSILLFSRKWTKLKEK